MNGAPWQLVERVPRWAQWGWRVSLVRGINSSRQKGLSSKSQWWSSRNEYIWDGAAQGQQEVRNQKTFPSKWKVTQVNFKNASPGKFGTNPARYRIRSYSWDVSDKTHQISGLSSTKVSQLWRSVNTRLKSFFTLRETKRHDSRYSWRQGQILLKTVLCHRSILKSLFMQSLSS